MNLYGENILICESRPSILQERKVVILRITPLSLVVLSVIENDINTLLVPIVVVQSELKVYYIYYVPY